ncbi:acyl-CoA dehydrogenase [Spinactinospora alkalitolerans]|uniref:Acyl-CoA dehydrogenase n=1 Tax=Spinactinospora alkalitolerans TaxID=687207 RepID=A0A852TUU8_9ACTN|nr:acyl-CoA dehydrogenase family protein [Spinactinospora alkalitolerans]NYE47718.1 acyl-CoA dehydrogenase [Spinactinospora alkalitolerans]
MFDLPPDHQGIKDEAARLADSLRPIAARADEADRVDADVAAALRESGLCGLTVPLRHGGRHERVDPLAVTVARESLCAVSAHLDSLFALQGIGGHALAVSGNEALAAEWLPRVARLDAIAGLALTEPDAGSDLKNIGTRVRAKGGELVVSGHKTFISNGADADFFTVLCREDEGHSLVLVPAGLPGVTVRPSPQIMAPHVLGDIEFADVAVPESHRLSAPGGGFAPVLATLSTFRVSVAGAAVGLAQAALDEAVRHTREREQFGRPLIGIGAVGQMLALSWTEIEMARSLTYRAAWQAGRDARAALHLSSMAKVGATETAGRVVDRSVQAMGRFGLVRGSVIERLYRTARPMRVYEGGTEVILDSLAKTLAKGEA